MALEAAGVALPDPAELRARDGRRRREAGRAARCQAAARSRARPSPREGRRSTKPAEADDDIDVPRRSSRSAGGAARRACARSTSACSRPSVYGAAHVPPFGGFIVAANHASHLDMGLVKHALGDWGEALVALAAKDYFFEDPVKRAYFENFTNLVPMDRHGSLRESLRLAAR